MTRRSTASFVKNESVRRWRRSVELEAVVAGRQRSLEEVADPAVGVGQGLGHAERAAVVDVEPVERDVDAGRRHPTFRVEDVGRDGRRPGDPAPLRPRYPPHMGTLQIEVGDLHFSARWEAAAPQTIEAIRRMLPIESKLIHCRWTGESTWIPFGDFRPGLDYENHTSHPAPGQLAIYPGGISECEIFFPYGGCTTASKVGQLAANHFATVVPDEGWDDRLREIGRRCLWEGAQAIRSARWRTEPMDVADPDRARRGHRRRRHRGHPNASRGGRAARGSDGGQRLPRLYDCGHGHPHDGDSTATTAVRGDGGGVAAGWRRWRSGGDRCLISALTTASWRCRMDGITTG